MLAGTDVSRSHTFRIVNHSDRPVPIRSVANRKPCCGDVAEVPATTIEPGQVLEIPVTLKLGLGSGQVVHVAAIEVEGTDEEINLSTMATAQARATVDAIDPTSHLLEPGQTQGVEFLIRSFGVQADPPRALDNSAIRCDLPTEWVEPATSEAGTDSDITSVHRTLAVTLPATVDPGRQRAELAVVNSDGAIIGRRPVEWNVLAALVASPDGLILTANDRADQSLRVIVRSRDNRPFRILEAKTILTDLTVATDAGAKPAHVIRCLFAASDRPGTRTGEVVIRTDHPDQSLIKLAVYVAGSGTKATPPEPSRSGP